MGAARVIVVVLVFVVSLSALAASSALALWEGTDELTARDQLRAAADELAATAREPAGGLPSNHAAVPAHHAHAPSGNPLDLRATVAEAERRVIRQALEQAGGNRTRAAALLGISRRQLFDKIRAYGLDG